MRTVQDIIFGLADQKLVFDAPEGGPSSVTSVSVFPWDASDDADSEWSASGSLDTLLPFTISASFGASQSNPRSISSTDIYASGMVIGRTYLATAVSGLKEWAELESLTTSGATVRHPLHNDYTTSATIVSPRITSTVDSTWVAAESNLRDDAGPNPHYRVRWVYVVSGVTHVADTYFNLVRYAGTHGVLPQDVESFSAGWLDRLPTDHRNNQGRTLIDDAYRAVKFDLHAIWNDDAMVANAELIDELTRYKTIELGEFAKILAGGGDSVQYQVARDAYRVRFDSLSRITNKAPTRDTTGAASQRPAIGLSRR